ncbi:unnamed protein product, partial [marine sediment metagenome]
QNSPLLKFHFTTQESSGVAYTHINDWGKTDEDGRLRYDLKPIPTRWVMTVLDGDRVILRIDEIRTDLGNEYRRGGIGRGNWRACCTPGRYSFDGLFEFVGK